MTSRKGKNDLNACEMCVLKKKHKNPFVIGKSYQEVPWVDSFWFMFSGSSLK